MNIMQSEMFMHAGPENTEMPDTPFFLVAPSDLANTIMVAN